VVLPADQVAGTDKLDKGALKAAREHVAEGMRKNSQEIYAMLSSGAQRSAFQISQDARDTYHTGGVISCSHDLHVTLRTGSCITNPTVTIQLKIGTPPIAPPPTSSVVMGMPLVAVPVLVLPEGMALDKDEQQAFTGVPADWSGAVVAEAVALPMGTAVLGGSAMHGGDLGDDEMLNHATLGSAAYPAQTAGSQDLAARLEQLAQLHSSGVLTDAEFEAAKNKTIAEGAPPPAYAPGSMEKLLAEMEATFDDYTLLSQRVTEDEWRPLLSSLDPASFGKIVGTVNILVAQPAVAELLGRQMASGVTCAHCAAAIRAASATYQGVRTGVAAKVAPLCVDLNESRQLIEAELSPWEQVVAKQALSGA
jgi:hypothetical protein